MHAPKADMIPPTPPPPPPQKKREKKGAIVGGIPHHSNLQPPVLEAGTLCVSLVASVPHIPHSPDDGYETVSKPTPFGTPLPHSSVSTPPHISPLALLTPSVTTYMYMYIHCIVTYEYSCLSALCPSPLLPSPASPCLLCSQHSTLLTPHSSQQSLHTSPHWLLPMCVSDRFLTLSDIIFVQLRVRRVNTPPLLSSPSPVSSDVISTQSDLESYLRAEGERELQLLHGSPDAAWPARQTPDQPSNLRKYHVATRLGSTPSLCICWKLLSN